MITIQIVQYFNGYLGTLGHNGQWVRIDLENIIYYVGWRGFNRVCRAIKNNNKNYHDYY